MATLRERVNERMQALGLNPNQLAKSIGTAQGTVWSLLSGRTKTIRDIEGLAVALETTPEWLLTGKGSSKSSHALIEADPGYQKILEHVLDAWNTKKYKIRAADVLPVAERVFLDFSDKSPEELNTVIDTLLRLEEKKT